MYLLVINEEDNGRFTKLFIDIEQQLSSLVRIFPVSRDDLDGQVISCGELQLGHAGIMDHVHLNGSPIDRVGKEVLKLNRAWERRVIRREGDHWIRIEEQVEERIQSQLLT
jgi:hypothetical protein